MKVKELITYLKKFEQDREILISSDEEMNQLFKEFELGNYDNKYIVVFGLSGTEMEEY